MIQKTLILGAAVAALGLAAACTDKTADAHAGKALTAAGAAPPPTAASAAPPSTATPPATSAAASTGGAAGRTYDCGARDQKPCPLQGWMKRVMAKASAADDGPALVKAFNFTADHAPPGLAGWSAIAKGGADKAKAGDLDGARDACKQCHDAYKDRYKATMRDRPI